MEEKLNSAEIICSEHPEIVLENARPFVELMSQHKCALMEVETKLRVLNAEFSLEHNRNPFESIKTRLKTPISILGKLKRKGLELSMENIENKIFDIAGIRVICSFPEDIYILADLLTKQDDIILVERKDYIANPKPNGYRSLHLILDIPIFLSQGKKHMKVEVQFRTIAMDFWASVEHKLKYKKDIEDGDRIVAELKKCADIISDMDYRMQDIRETIERSKLREEKAEKDQKIPVSSENTVTEKNMADVSTGRSETEDSGKQE